MSWATPYINILATGEKAVFRPSGHSMAGIVEHRQEVTVVPLAPDEPIGKGDVVLCRVKGRDYLHLVKAIANGRYQIGNNRGGINGWIGRNHIFGRMARS